MGIFCEISLCKSADGVYYPGSTVAGKIKYSLDEPTVFSNISVSLQGHGWLLLEDQFQKRNNQLHSYRNSEDYVDIDTVIHNNDKGEPLPKGSYETDFSFNLPNNIPGSYKCIKNKPKYHVRCYVKYYVLVKFEKPEMLKFNKHYKKKIRVISDVVPRLQTEPTVHGTSKSLWQLRSLITWKTNSVSIKATIATAVVQPGEKVKIDYEIENKSNLTLNGVEIKLVQVDKFTSASRREAKFIDSIEGTDVKYGAVQSQETKTYSDEISIPSELASLDHSKIIARDYAVSITAVIPLPHSNLDLEIPVQVVNRLNGAVEKQGSSDALPAKWESMKEMTWERLGVPSFDSSDDEK